MQETDLAAALAAIERDRSAYPIIRSLPEDLRARLEPAERLKRYGELALELQQDARRIMRGSSDPASAIMDRIELSLVMNALYDSIKALDRQRAEAEEARWHRMDADDAATGGRSLAEILDNERRLEERVALLECRIAECTSIKRCGTADGPAMPAGR